MARVRAKRRCKIFEASFALAGAVFDYDGPPHEDLELLDGEEWDMEFAPPPADVTKAWEEAKKVKREDKEKRTDAAPAKKTRSKPS